MDSQSLLAAFRIAIDKEDEAFASYTDLAKRTDDPELKALFQRFANEEFVHSETIKELYSALRNKVRPGGMQGEAIP